MRLVASSMWLYKDAKLTRYTLLVRHVMFMIWLIAAIALGKAILLKGVLALVVNCSIAYVVYNYSVKKKDPESTTDYEGGSDDFKQM